MCEFCVCTLYNEKLIFTYAVVFKKPTCSFFLKEAIALREQSRIFNRIFNNYIILKIIARNSRDVTI